MSSADMAWSLAKRAYSNTKFLKGIINSEKKFTDITISGNPSDTVPLQVFLNDVPVGDLGNQRDGMSVRIKSLSIKTTFSLHPDTAESRALVRCIVFQWYNTPDSASADLDKVLETLDINAHYHKDYLGNFQVLYDRVHILDADNPIRQISIYKKLNMISRWNLTNTSGDEPDLHKNGLFFACFSNQTTTTPTISGISRILFYDN